MKSRPLFCHPVLGQVRLGAQTEDVSVHFHGFGRVLVEDLPSVNEKLDSKRIFRATPTRILNSRASVIGNGESIHGTRIQN